MSEKIEGTFILDGLVEGRVPQIPGAEEKLREWAKFAQSAKLNLNLETDGNGFNLLADNTPVPAASIGPDPAEVVESALREMLKIFPPADRGRIYSTLRSAEYKKGQELQTLYRVRPDGTIEAQSRSVDAKTAAPPAPMTGGERARLAFMGLLIAVAIFGISSIFVDYRALWRQTKDQFVPIKPESITVDASAFADYFTVAEKRINREAKTPVLILKLQRTAQMPVRLSDVEMATTRPTTNFEKRLVLDCLARGYVRVESFDEKDRYRASDSLRILPLREKESIEVGIAIDREHRPSRIVITY